MKAINNELQALVIELQKFNSVNSFALAGGTSLSIRFNHRISVDIDLFTNKIVGKTGLLLIVSELKEFYKEALKFSEFINEESGDQYCFLRALIKINGIDIKVEFIQNIQFIDPVETYNGIKILSKKDIGLFKLVSASNRKAKKDIYDLDFITDEIQLNDLFEQLEIKSKKYSQEEHKCLFELDNEVNPINDISLLLEFDNIDYTALPSRPSHSNDMIDIIPQNKSWPAARSSWRLKVRQLMHDMGIPLPPVKPIN